MARLALELCLQAPHVQFLAAAKAFFEADCRRRGGPWVLALKLCLMSVIAGIPLSGTIMLPDGAEWPTFVPSDSLPGLNGVQLQQRLVKLDATDAGV